MSHYVLYAHVFKSPTQMFSADLGSAAVAPPPGLGLGERTLQSKYQSGPLTAGQIWNVSISDVLKF